MIRGRRIEACQPPGEVPRTGSVGSAAIAHNVYYVKFHKRPPRLDMWPASLGILSSAVIVAL